MKAETRFIEKQYCVLVLACGLCKKDDEKRH